LERSTSVNRYVRIVWTDCQGDAHGWTPVDELDKRPCVITTVGMLVEPPPRPGHTTVALSTYGHDGEVPQVDSVVHLPDVCIHSIDDLAVVLSFPDA
jgi:hypothetical protein